jgi:hypothetical protein
MPLANLCNRLVVTSIRPTPNSQASGFRLSTRRGPESAVPQVNRDTAKVQSQATPESRCRPLRPWVATRLTPCRPAAIRVTASPCERNRRAAIAQEGVLGPQEPGELTTGAPTSLDGSRRGGPGSVPKRLVKLAWGARPGTPSTDRSRTPHEGSSPSPSTRAATGTLVLPPRAQLPT